MHTVSVSFGQMRQNWSSLATDALLMFGGKWERHTIQSHPHSEYYAVGMLQCLLNQEFHQGGINHEERRKI